MKELLTSNGWIPKGYCSQCGIQNWVNASFPYHIVKTKDNANLFKIVKNGADLFPMMNGAKLSEKLEELKMQEV